MSRESVGLTTANCVMFRSLMSHDSCIVCLNSDIVVITSGLRVDGRNWVQVANMKTRALLSINNTRSATIDARALKLSMVAVVFATLTIASSSLLVELGLAKRC